MTITRPLVSLAGVVSRPRSVDHRPSKITAENSPRKWPLSGVKRTLWFTSPQVCLKPKADIQLYKQRAWITPSFAAKLPGREDTDGTPPRHVRIMLRRLAATRSDRIQSFRIGSYQPGNRLKLIDFGAPYIEAFPRFTPEEVYAG